MSAWQPSPLRNRGRLRSWDVLSCPYRRRLPGLLSLPSLLGLPANGCVLMLVDQGDREDRVDQVDVVLQWRGLRENAPIPYVPHSPRGQPDPGQGVERHEEQAEHRGGEP